MAELFENFDVERKPLWPRLLRTVTLSVFLHAVLALTVFYGPTMYAFWELASAVTGVDYSDEEYALGQVRERAVMLEPGDVLLDVPPDYVKVQEEAVEAPQPTPEPKPTPSPTPNNGGDTAGSLVETIAQASDVPLPPRLTNVRPFKDFLAKWSKKYDEGQLDLNNTVEVTIEADRREDGTLENMELTGASASDPIMKELAVDTVQAIGASGALSFLEGARRVKLHLILDRQKLSVEASSEVETAERASKMASVYSLGITAMRWRKSGTDEGVVWEKTTVRSKGKEVVINFEMPRDAAGSLLAKQVEKVRTEP